MCCTQALSWPQFNSLTIYVLHTGFELTSVQLTNTLHMEQLREIVWNEIETMKIGVEECIKTQVNGRRSRQTHRETGIGHVVTAAATPVQTMIQWFTVQIPSHCVWRWPLRVSDCLCVCLMISNSLRVSDCLPVCLTISYYLSFWWFLILYFCCCCFQQFIIPCRKFQVTLPG